MACQAFGGNPSDASAPQSATGAASVTETLAPPPSTNEREENALELANAWAEAVKNLDGKAQYALYTKDYQEKVHETYEWLYWVTGTSSPWVESYTVELTAGGASMRL